MKLNEAEMRMAYQIEATSQNAALNEIYMTWRYTQNQATKDTAESLLAKLRPLSDKECMDMIREVQTNYHCPERRGPLGKCWRRPGSSPGRQNSPGMTLWLWSGLIRIPAT